MSDPRYATAEEVAVVRERVAKMEGGHDNLRGDMQDLNRQFSDFRRDITHEVQENAIQTQQKISEMNDKSSKRDGEISDRLARIEGGMKLTSWVTMTFIVLATGLLGWGQIGDAAWSFCKRAFGYGA
ncbi:hypothetical protein KTQ54_16010 [Komagataeibacter oboediens]|uniref:hypothetical protein n=1 Tax=Komagataeibacter oboediens TaxID=65958 RepID=UPI001905A731|nr:hypothetical protein [Komagataeibacter oboediens]MBV0890006.1 hypothetical protein [Komagataeibacter oboediens]MBV1825747.1 hypothetical protein [Komagataeibacter oboediens]MCK9818616.1 hypothetical protein [Komagataeibacter oboediens]GCE81715.1 hypothetical protein MSKU3_3190 [Komagataeibacter oboediens]